MSQLGINSVVRLVTGGALISLHFFLYQFRVFEVPNTVWGWVFTFVVIDFVFYWYHRAQHRVRFHVVCPRGASLERAHEFGHGAAGSRPPALYPRAVLLAAALLGFHPLLVASAGAVATIYGFWTHTEVIKKLWAPLEWLLVTPSHHRAHHGSNPSTWTATTATCSLCGTDCSAPSSPRLRRCATGC